MGELQKNSLAECGAWVHHHALHNPDLSLRSRSGFHFSVHPDTDGPAVVPDFPVLSSRSFVADQRQLPSELRGAEWLVKVLAASEPANNSGHIARASTLCGCCMIRAVMLQC